MKFILTFFFIISCHLCYAQNLGAKVSFTVADGKSYTGTITDIDGDKCKVKYDGFDFASWMLKTQFTVTQEPTQAPAEQPPAPAFPQTQSGPGPGQQAPQPADDSPAGNVLQNTGGNSTAMTRADSLKMAITDLRKAFDDASKLFIRKSDTLTILIPDIEYENPGLAKLKESLEKIKGTRSVIMHYSKSTARLEVAFKGKPADLWNGVPPDIRTMFKLVEAGERNITLAHK